MYKESNELKALTAELKKDNLSRRDAQAFETVDWYVKRLLGKDHLISVSTKEDMSLRSKLHELLETWNNERNP